MLDCLSNCGEGGLPTIGREEAGEIPVADARLGLEKPEGI